MAAGAAGVGQEHEVFFSFHEDDAVHSHRRPRHPPPSTPTGAPATPRRPLPQAPPPPPAVHSHRTTTYLRERTTFCASCVQRLLLCFARTAACTPAGAVTRREGPATVDTPAAKSRPRLTRQPRRAACREEQLERDRPRRAGRCLDASQLSSRRAGDRGRAKAQFSVASRVFSAASPPSFHGRPQAWRPGSRRRSGLVEAP